MAYPILDDVEELLRRGRGDAHILHRIMRAAQQGEVISVYERSYVAGLADEFLRPRSLRTTPVQRPAPVSAPMVQAPPRARRLRRIFGPLSRLKTRRMALVTTGVLVTLVAVLVYAGTGTSSNTTPDTPVVPASGLLVTLDSASYMPGDIVSISGITQYEGDVALTIHDAAGLTVWHEDAISKEDGTYSKLLIAGGPGWESGGAYTLDASHAGKTEQVTFAFGG